MKDSISTRFKMVNEQINDLSLRRTQNSSKIKLVVVTKRQPIERCQEVIEAGAVNLGENYPEEATIKFQSGETNEIQLHLIGHLQSRKAKLIPPLFSYWQTIDRYEIAEKVNEYSEKDGKQINSLVEINLTNEPSKSGYIIQNNLDEERLFLDIAKMLSLPWLNICGLMTMGFYPDTAETNRKIFHNCRILLEKIQAKFQIPQFFEISMGTSGDYITAIEEGSTIVRIGEKIMGSRSPKETA